MAAGIGMSDDDEVQCAANAVIAYFAMCRWEQLRPQSGPEDRLAVIDAVYSVLTEILAGPDDDGFAHVKQWLELERIAAE
jgi:hypothetical protein